LNVNLPSAALVAPSLGFMIKGFACMLKLAPFLPNAFALFAGAVVYFWTY